MNSQSLHFGEKSLPDPSNHDDISRYKLSDTSTVKLSSIVSREGYNSRSLIQWRVQYFLDLYLERIKDDIPFFDDGHVFHVMCSSDKLEYVTCDVQHRLEAARQLAKLGFIEEDHEFTVWP